MARKSVSPWYRSGKNCWYVWHQGKLVRLHKDKDEAHRLWHLLLAGAWPEQQPTLSPPSSQALPLSQPLLTVGGLIDAYLADVQLRLKASTLLSKRKVLLRLKAEMGADPAVSLRPAVVTTWLAKQRGWGRSLRWLAAAVVRSCCRWAVPSLLPSDPTVGLKLPGPVSRGADTLISQDDHSRLLAVAPGAFRDALLALHGTGCRPGELCKVEARYVDVASGTWLLNEHKTDGRGKVRVILLPPAVQELSKRLAEAHPFGPLFRDTKGKPLTPERLSATGSSRRGDGWELGRIIAYGYRHSYATDALAAGVPDAQVAELLGHSGTTMLHKHYSHLTAKTKVLREALGRVRGKE